MSGQLGNSFRILERVAYAESKSPSLIAALAWSKLLAGLTAACTLVGAGAAGVGLIALAWTTGFSTGVRAGALVGITPFLGAAERATGAGLGGATLGAGVAGAVLGAPA